MIRFGFRPTEAFAERVAKMHRDSTAPKTREAITASDVIDELTNEASAGEELALRGFSHEGLDNVFFNMTLDDVEVTSVEFPGGDDPSISRDANRDKMRELIATAFERSLNSGMLGAEESDPDHFAKLPAIFESVAQVMGPQPDTPRAPDPHTQEFIKATEVVVGDTLRWTERWQLLHDNGESSHHSCEAVADVVKRSDDNSVLTVFIKRGYGSGAVSEGCLYTFLDLYPVNILKAERKVWVDENERAERVKVSCRQSHSRACGTGMHLGT